MNQGIGVVGLYVHDQDKALEFYDSGHRLPPEYVTRAVGWLKQRLAPR